MKNGNQTCDNCSYFAEHYIKRCNGIFTKVNCGHCVNSVIARKKREKILRTERTCELWEPVELKIQERKCSIIKRIEYMEEHLSQIKQILKEDCEHTGVQ